MKRRKFIANACISCMGLSSLSVVLNGCGVSSSIINSPINGSNLLVNLVHFENHKKGVLNYKKYIIVQNEKMQYPICIYRTNEKTYTALLLNCTHQGAELQVFGDKMQCPAHGSEFDNKGKVINGPASEDLRSFPITILKDKLNISLT